VHPPPRQRAGKLGLREPRGPLDHVILHTWGHSLHYAALLPVDGSKAITLEAASEFSSLNHLPESVRETTPSVSTFRRRS
jgi:hypothetical protein